MPKRKIEPKKLAPDPKLCPACGEACNCVCCDGTGVTTDEETGEPERCLVCNGEYWGGRRGRR